MKIREYMQENSIDIGTSGTKTYDLDYTDPITQIDLFFEGTNGASGNEESPFERCISKIELIDGGEVLWDLPGEVALAAFCHDNEAMPYSEIEEAQNASIRQQIPIRFGRWLFDTDYALDPRKHKHPQLRFTFNEATINAAGTTGFVSDSWTFTLHVRLMEGAPAPKGFLSYRSVESFTTAAGGARRVELPTDRKIRYLICRAYEDGVALYTNITHHKLAADGGKWVGFDLPARDFINRMCETFKPLTRKFVAFITDEDVRETFIGVPHNGHLNADIAGCILTGNFYIYGQVLVYRKNEGGAADTPGMTYISNTGWAMHNTLIYAFGDRMKPEHWLDPKAFGKLDYFVTDGDAGADCDICLQQLYPY